ncbi:MAG: UDP-N-acetylmuramate--L-alanine ligase [Candidatus Cloacimonetes bacterium]|jgi:UDP-N-acetylmuramate--alanine ligase|nr:UDP-N-acetylmuramate--L-alanine ligase [Candidatus Cloacimonadota bacterium]MCB5287215.1 UDP-N-acetylmuramate--L-alanine ligase [Candidatus Cloacimonadota bacterium]MCK9184860.1 UDP-N-acetylmuramate--L-alanine ligase [Candidatus Cloacimonadota bacterium]MCK9583325.1 UDP-N-acetylmuramate--L-alanine ligase [Candidatus Cloacimonadota bacterium]MDY0229536.1 UDP-N-acetylmuramate--L-alanine ligase [Candidatus Cloacimonadaceae bacterium]
MLGRTRKIHFIGIGGIGMSGIAEFLHNQGLQISGSDMKKTDVTSHLEDIGIKVVEGHDPSQIEDADVVVKSSAVHDDNAEIVAAKALKIPVIRRAEMLAEITRMSFSIGISGTHGKTTTTSMAGLVLETAGLEPTIIVGGKVKNFGSNNVMGSGKYIVVEADEYDHSFLTLTPCIAGITNVDEDHLDCYRNLDDIKGAFIEYANKVPFFGSVIACLDDPGVQAILPQINKKIVTYGLSRQADVQALDIVMKDFTTSYSLAYKGYKLGRITMNVTGKHNVQNSLMAAAIGLELDLPFKSIQDALAKYSGVFRRFELKGEANDIIVYDDYAHHPTEIMATLEGFKDSVDRRIVALFQPHLYSRTRDLYEKFGKSFFSCDCLILAPIYPAREQAIPNVSSQLIADVAIQSGHHQVHVVENNEQIASQALALLKPGDLFITMGAGNIWQYGEEILAELKKRVDTISKPQKSSNL